MNFEIEMKGNEEKKHAQNYQMKFMQTNSKH